MSEYDVGSKAEYDRKIQNVLATSVTVKHLFSRLGTFVKVYCKDAPNFEGILKSIEIFRGIIEVENADKVYFINLHKLSAIEGQAYKKVL